MGIEINTTSGTVPDVVEDFFPFTVILVGIKSFAGLVTRWKKFNFQLVANVYEEINLFVPIFEEGVPLLLS